MTELSYELERQALTLGHETSAVTTQRGEGIHERESGESHAAPLGDEPATTEEVAMPTMTASQTTATKYRPILVRLPFSPEPISPMVALSPPPDCRFTFKPGAWERLVVAAELDRESRGLPPAP
jgi:hypothetical protein